MQKLSEIKSSLDLVLSTEEDTDEDSNSDGLSTIASMDDSDKLHEKSKFNFSFSSQKAHQYYLYMRIYATSEMSSINYIMQRESRDVAVFDADDNLITSFDVFYQKHVLLDSPLSQKMRATNEIRREIFFHCMATKLFPWSIIEPYTPKLVADLQESGMYAMVLTALNSVIVPEIDLHTPNWRTQHFEDLGFNFSRGFNVNLIHGFSREHSNNPFEPYFKRGIMLSGDIPKGKALVSFFRVMKYRPKSVIFVDDYFPNVYSVYIELSREGIECHCVLYTRKHHYSFKDLFTLEMFEKSLEKVEAAINLFIEQDEAYEQKMKHDKVLSSRSFNPISVPDDMEKYGVARDNDNVESSNIDVKILSEVDAVETKTLSDLPEFSYQKMLKEVNKEIYTNGVTTVLGNIFGRINNLYSIDEISSSTVQQVSPVIFSKRKLLPEKQKVLGQSFSVNNARVAKSKK